MGTVKIVENAKEQIDYIKKALKETPSGNVAELGKEARRIGEELHKVDVILNGKSHPARHSEAIQPGLVDRVSAQVEATAAITGANKRNYEIAAEGFEKVLTRLKILIETDMKNLSKKLEKAGAPWTPGRGIPDWKK